MLGIIASVVLLLLIAAVVVLGSRQLFTRVDYSAPDTRRAGDERTPAASRNHGGTSGLIH